MLPTSPYALAKKMRQGQAAQPMTAQGPNGPTARVPAPTVTASGVALGRPTPLGMPRPTGTAVTGASPRTLATSPPRGARVPSSMAPPASPPRAQLAPMIQPMAAPSGAPPIAPPVAPAMAPPPPQNLAAMLQPPSGDASRAAGGSTPWDAAYTPMPAGDGSVLPSRGLDTPGAIPTVDPYAPSTPSVLPPGLDAPTGGAGPIASTAPAAGAAVSTSGPTTVSTGMLDAPPERTTPPASDLTNLDPLNQGIRRQTQSWLDDPSPYDDALFQKQVDAARFSHDQETQRGRDRIAEDGARRGVDFGSIAGKNFVGFEKDRAGAWDRNVLTPMLADRAQGIAGARAQAFDAANGERGYYDGQRNLSRDQELQRIQLEEAIRSGRVGEDQSWMQMLLNGYGNTAGTALDGAGMQAGASAGAANGVGGLAQLLAQYYGNRGTALPGPAIPAGGR